MSEGTVLLVEDDPDDAELTLRALSRMGFGHPVAVARDGQEALDRLKSPAGSPLPSLILLDLNLPGISGLELLDRIRKDADLKHLPVVILTSSNEPSDRAKAKSLGVDGYLIKALDPSDVREMIRVLDQALADAAGKTQGV